MGRADQTAKVKGMFVKPSQIADVARRHPEIRKYRLVIGHDAKKADCMTLHCEIAGARQSSARRRHCGHAARRLQPARRRRIDAAGALPNDGKVIDDVRKYD